MANSNYIKGTGYWMKVLGDPVDNFAKDGKEWTFEVTVDKDAKKVLKDAGLEKRIKNKGDERGDYFQFKQKATRKDGTPNRPISVYDARNRPWDQSAKIGSGSLVEAKFNVVEYGAGIQAGVYVQGIRVLEYVPYERQEFAALPEDSEYVKNAPAAKEGAIKGFDTDSDLDDSVDF